MKGKVPVIGSIFAASPEEFATLAVRMEEYGAAGVELNLSCPHAKGYGMEMGVDPEVVGNIVREVKSAIGCRCSPSSRPTPTVSSKWRRRWRGPGGTVWWPSTP